VVVMGSPRLVQRESVSVYAPPKCSYRRDPAAHSHEPSCAIGRREILLNPWMLFGVTRSIYNQAPEFLRNMVAGACGGEQAALFFPSRSRFLPTLKNHGVSLVGLPPTTKLISL